LSSSHTTCTPNLQASQLEAASLSALLTLDEYHANCQNPVEIRSEVCFTAGFIRTALCNEE
ncbi:hypothetical protein, partial [Corynebacterium sp. HMSC073D01]|uniref:hypothetical protein n=1 Tax=Corynebacterium sp. HMSC073D01 TaxID=1739536 RepID=UPI001AEF9D30